MESELFKRVIEGQKAEIESKFKAEKMIERESLDFAKKFLKYPNILAIVGVRRCGKSIFSMLLAKNSSKNFAYVNFDDERFTGIKAGDLDRLLQAAYELYGNIDLIVLDEIQGIEGWELFANRLRRTKKVIVTGSNSQLLSGELASALTGRHIDVFLRPFSFKESLRFKPNLFLTEDIAKVRKALEAYIKGSGFPEYLKFGPEIVVRIYEDIINKDCIRRHEIRNEGSFREIAIFLVSNFASEFSYSRLSKMSSIKDIHTVKNYVEYLKQSFLIHVLERFSFKLKQQIIAPKKVYCVDQGLANFLGFNLTKNTGRLFENIVCIELFSRCQAMHGANVYYYRDSSSEVDFLVKRGTKVEQLIQVCHDVSELKTKEKEVKALIKASKELKCGNLLVITNDFEAEQKIKGKKIKFIPLWKWLLKEGKQK